MRKRQDQARQRPAQISRRELLRGRSAHRRQETVETWEPDQPPAPARTSGTSKRPRRWPFLRRLTRIERALLAGWLAIAGAVVVGIVLALPVSPAAPAHTGTVVIWPARAGLACVQDIAWSPNGARVAVLGSLTGCPPGSPGQRPAPRGLIVVYDTATGLPTARFQPDAAIQRALQPLLAAAPGAAPDASTGPRQIVYAHILWSPDGRRLALPFSVAAASDDPTVTVGVFLSDAHGAHSAVFLHSTASDDTPGIWDLSTGSYQSEASAEEQAALAPALSYAWHEGGTLVPENTSTLPAPGAIGAPDGGVRFTIWQPAQVTLQTTYDTQGHATAPGIALLRTSFAAWSPDGRYLLTALTLTARVAPPDGSAPPAAQLAALGLAEVPSVPMRDAGERTALGRLATTAAVQGLGEPMLLAWNPGGTALAVQLVPAEPSESPSATHRAIIVYRCATGAARGAFVPAAGTALGGVPLLRWSPDGTRLLLFDSTLGSLNIFQIPAADRR
jgi:hypothetical protein